jgi:hypothetical protein
LLLFLRWLLLSQHDYAPLLLKFLRFLLLRFPLLLRLNLTPLMRLCQLVLCDCVPLLCLLMLYVYGLRFALPVLTPKPCPYLFPCRRQTLAKIALLRLVMRMLCYRHQRQMLFLLR